MCKTALNFIGLLAGILGTGILFYQTMYFEERMPTNGSLVLHEPDAPIAKRGRIAARLSRWGFGLLFLSFILQSVALFMR